MKQSLSKTSDQDSSEKEKDFKVCRTNRLKKFRDARKQKASIFSESTSQDGKTVTKEQKIQIKKLRNREAAQRARDRAKVYTVELQKELLALKSQVILLRNRQFVCSKCNRQSEPTTRENNIQMVEQIGEYFFQEQKIEELQPMFDLQRVKNNHSFSFPMFLMIISIVLCLFSPVTESPTIVSFQKRPHRLLQQIVNVSQFDKFTNMRDKVYPHKQTGHQENENIHSNHQQQQFKQSFQNYKKVDISPSESIYLKANDAGNSTNLQSTQFQPVMNGSQVKLRDYDVLYCDQSRIYRYGNQKNSQLNQQVKIIIKISNLKEVENQTLSEQMSSDSYETTTKLTKVHQFTTKF